MNRAAFLALGDEGYALVPVTRRVLADLDTPLSAYLKLGAGPLSYLFESVQGGERWGRYSIIGLPARTAFRVRGNTVRTELDGKIIDEETVADPLAWVDAIHARYRVPVRDDLPRFSGGLVGYFGYDTVRYIEPRLADSVPPDVLGADDIVLMLSEELLVFDNLAGTITCIVHADPRVEKAWEAAHERLEAIIAALNEPGRRPLATAEVTDIAESDYRLHFPQAKFEAGVERIKAYIEAGDVMQVVLSQRLSADFGAPPIDLYRALRSFNPSPYMFFVDCGDLQVVGASPEILVRLEEGEVTVRPIAGTRPRGEDAEADAALEADLLADPKEIAEHVMLIDLGRNDIGRVCDTGTVALTERMAVERYSHVMHIVSNVAGRCREGLGPIDVLRATFPAGTLSGASKVRAMEIIDELERVKRGVYGGAVGYLSWHGNMDTAIAIRTAVVKNGEVHVQAGAGIVADSVPEREWEETMNKARALIRAASLAARGLAL